MKTFLCIFVIVGCFTIGPGAVVLALMSIPMILSEWIFNGVQSVFGPVSSGVAGLILAFSVVICVAPLFTFGKKGTRP